MVLLFVLAPLVSRAEPLSASVGAAIATPSVLSGETCRQGNGGSLRQGLAKIVADLLLKNARSALGGMAIECDRDFELGWAGKRLEACRAERLKEAATAEAFAAEFKSKIAIELGQALVVDARIFPRAAAALEQATTDEGDAVPRTLGNLVAETVKAILADNCPTTKEEETPLLLKLVKARVSD